MSRVTGIDAQHLRRGSRHKTVLFARYFAIRLLRDEKFTHQAIAEALGSSRQGIAHALRVHDELIASDYLYRNSFEAVQIQKKLTTEVKNDHY